MLTFPSEGIGTNDLDCGATPPVLPVIVGGYPTCTYMEAKTYIVKASNTITRFNLGTDQDQDPDDRDAAKLIDVKQWGTADWTSMETAFARAKNMRMSATDAPKLGGVTSMLGMFFEAEVFDGNISNWEVDNVEIMRTMFSGATAFDRDISGWVVSRVTDMGSMFGLAETFNQDIGGWDVSSVTKMDNMFNGAILFNQDISRWDVSSVDDMTNMFATSNFNQNLGRWYVTDSPARITPTLEGQNSRLNNQNPTYTLVAGNGDADNDLFTIDVNSQLYPKDILNQALGTYSVRISISGGNVFSTGNNEVAIEISISESSGLTFYAFKVLDDSLGLTAAAEAQILNAILPQLFRATAKITVDNISNRIDQAFSSSPTDTDASLNLGGSSSLQELINNNARTTLQDGLNIKQMFNNSSFLIPLNVAGDNNYGINNITLWGSGDYLSLEDDVSAVDWEGEVIG
ncbi:MAG: DUF285 domain-containing protein, partial [Methylococcales symbiont of Hymedesmia sp. n. MRB-2018]